MTTNNPDFAIEAEGVSRSYGDTAALTDFTLRVPRGSIYGFLGRNGAGKTTAIKILTGLIKPDQGTVRVLGTNPFAFTAQDRERVGYLSERQILPANMRAGGLFTLCAPFYARWDQTLVDRLVASFRLDLRKKIRTLSQGAQRQVAFILALAPRPELLILDEPASTLDVVARREFLDEILDLLRQEGPTIFLSSHILSDIERVADHIGILVDGKLKVNEPLDQLKETVKRVRFYGFDRDAAAFQVPGAMRAQRSENEWLITLRCTDSNLLAAAARPWGAQYEIQGLSLEEIFIDLCRH
jgi:ABC-type multidrug transport system ATPase subunit